MVKVNKLIKLSTNSSKVKSIIKNIKKISKHNRIDIKTYKTKLQGTNIPKHISTNTITTNNSIYDYNKDDNKDDSKDDNKDEDNYIIAIPSYKRADTIQTKTLAVLQQNNINPIHIHIFVANKEQYDIYNKVIPQHLYGKIIIGLLGLKNQRNYINDYYQEGTHVVEMDDDISSIVQLIIKKNPRKSMKDPKRSKSSKSKTYKPIKYIKPIADLDTFIKNAFTTCINNNSFIWGVYPIANAHFMTDTITKDLRFIVGPMWGMINRHIKDLKATIDEKENTERTLKYWTNDGIVVRFNNISIVTRYYKNKGGMQSEGKDRKVEAMKSAEYLHDKYPRLTKIFLGKKSGVPEVKLLRDL